MGKRKKTKAQELADIAEHARIQAMGCIDAVMGDLELTPVQRQAFYATLIDTLQVEAEAEGEEL